MQQLIRNIFGIAFKFESFCPPTCWGAYACIGALCASLIGGCRGFAYQHSDVVHTQAARAGVRRFIVPTQGYHGLSDLTRDNRGHFWAIPEKDRVLLELSMDPAHPGLASPAIPIEGIEPALDTESLAWMSPNKFALGTESQVPDREQDEILLVSVHGNRAHVTERIAFPYALWSMRAPANWGIEGMCFAGGHLIAASEAVGHLPQGGQRFAPIARLDSSPGQAHFVPFALRLTSQTGKISGIACRYRPGNSNIEILALERHYSVSRLLRFEIPQSADAPFEIVPQVVLDLAETIEGLPNYEGISWSDQGDAVILSDNFMAFATGPTEGLLIPASLLTVGRAPNSL